MSGPRAQKENSGEASHRRVVEVIATAAALLGGHVHAGAVAQLARFDGGVQVHALAVHLEAAHDGVGADAGAPRVPLRDVAHGIRREARHGDLVAAIANVQGEALRRPGVLAVRAFAGLGRHGAVGRALVLLLEDDLDLLARARNAVLLRNALRSDRAFELIGCDLMWEPKLLHHLPDVSLLERFTR